MRGEILDIHVTYASIQTAIPSAAHALRQVVEKNIQSRHVELGFRHPFAVYGSSISTICRRFLRVINMWSTAHICVSLGRELDELAAEELLEHTDQLLDALMEHMDDCEHIIESLIPAPEKGISREHKSYRAEVRFYRSHIGNIVNYIKHNHGRLRLVEIVSDTSASLGYFVEGPGENQGLGPAPTIHQGGRYAFSYSRDLRLHLCAIYAVSKALAKALRLAHPETDGESEHTQAHFADLHKCLALFDRLPECFYPDEIEKPVPSVTFNNGNVVLEYPATKRPKGIGDGSENFRVKVSYRADGVTSAFRLPYPLAEIDQRAKIRRAGF